MAEFNKRSNILAFMLKVMILLWKGHYHLSNYTWPNLIPREFCLQGESSVRGYEVLVSF